MISKALLQTRKKEKKKNQKNEKNPKKEKPLGFFHVVALQRAPARRGALEKIEAWSPP
jgi:hypothetical protein